jgi:hypothetical protein
MHHCRVSRPRGEGTMARRALIIVLLAVVALFVYLGYNSYDARRAGANGDVFSYDSPTGRAKTDVTNWRSRESQTVVYPPETVPVTTQAPKMSPSDEADRSAAPANDTISPNPPNGMVFSGTGKYQLYRQGNLTWRLNTDSGQSCILFATDDEWKKPRVYRAGCGSR